MSNALKNLLDSPDFPEGDAWQRRLCTVHEHVFNEGDSQCDVFVVLSGTVRVVGEVALDDDRSLRPGYSDLGPGTVFGEMCLFDLKPRSGSVVAISDCELGVIPGDILRVYLDAHPEVGYPVLKDLLNTLAERLRTANKRVSSLFAWGLKAHGIDEHL
ncbi:MAG: Crp/Fnr family transcriptional regulator [Gammaproteobacteria bacterium]|nr:Crp/Fnr family transcriptional regulator [Gammaproteobacteria bacterium]MCP5138185.1 Crp/Fnr family transcriptional regulator [Gammaproteobacteria bacterium]